MRSIAILAAVFATVATSCLAAEIVTVPLEPDEAPLYVMPGDDHRLAFDAGRELADITDLHLHVTGTYGAPRSVCWNFGDFGGGVWSYPEDHGLQIGFWEMDAPLCVTRCEFTPTEDGVIDYDLELAFECGGDPVDWSFLGDGIGVVTLTGLDCDHVPSYPEVCICEHSATVISAELVFRLGTGVTANRHAWGAVKDRYR